MTPGSRPGTLTRVRGVRVGHAVDPAGRTGVTVVRFAGASPTVVDVRGGASATYDVASLGLEATFGRRWGLFLSGGSLFGLDAARGLRDRILEEGGGHAAFRRGRRVAPVSGAALYDLPPDGEPIPDYAALGYEAAGRATDGPVAEGRVGAGAGATVAKYRGRAFARPGGLGSGAADVGRGRVGVLAVANSVGAIRDPFEGRWVETARDSSGRLLPPDDAGPRGSSAGTNLVVVVTDLPVDRPALFRIAVLAHTGLSRAVIPAHTSTDGDVVFAATTAEPAARRPERFPGEAADRIGQVAAGLVAASLLRAVSRP